MRIFELAKKLNVSSAELMELVEMQGIDAQNHFCALTPEQVAALTEDVTGEAPEPVPGAPAPAEPEAPTDAASAIAEEAVAEEVVAEVEAPAAEPEPEPAPEPEPEVEKGPPVLELFEDVTVKELAGKIDVKANVLIASLMKMGVFASINQKITRAQSKILAEANGFKVLTEPPKPKPELVVEAPKAAPKADAAGKTAATVTDAPEAPAKPKPVKEKKKKIRNTKGADGEGKAKDPSQVSRPPVITFLGHVDHGKTSLIDRIRKANVVKGEAGGITQHIGAYTIEINGKEITILDTPGHAAFSAMRARGADLTDIAIIVISADEGIKPQTREAIKHAQEAGVTLMVAANKIDLPNANVDRLKQELQKEGLAPEDWGGDTMVVPVSAMTGEGIDDLLEMVNLQAEILELTSTLGVPARGYVIEAELETGMGATASVLVTEGILNVGDAMLCGEAAGRIKALVDHTGKRVKSAGPSHAVKVMGLSDVPSPGDEFEIVKNDKVAKQMAAERQEDNRKSVLQGPERGLSLDDLFAQAGMDDIEELQILLKCDVKGSLEAITASLKDIKSDKVRLKFISSGIGPINENDVLLASSSGSLIIGFNVGKDNAAVRAAKHKGVEIRLYDIIYQLIDDITAAMTGLLKPVQQEKIIGHAEIRQIFKLRKARSVAGCIVIDGRIRAKARARVLRGKAKDIIYQGGVHTLKRFQDDVNEVGNGQECGIGLENYDDFETGDIIEVYLTEDVKQAL
ncbi:MAG: translation initiation factor IF-2 [Verrucomicrobia bacterium]|nr:translation initiation factor IF-2 [Verrucomicrobiota bacterium]MCH8528968.1 translation initiation factor IF-2 [Kiritimatiellia bacterium]